MKLTAIRVILVVTWLAAVGTAVAPGVVQAQRDPRDFVAVVEVDSLFAHAEPSLESDRVASVFEDQQLEVIGRSLDGTWFEVRRPGRLTGLGWLPAKYLDWDFYPEYLPLTNLTVGLEGPQALAEDPGYAIYMLSGANLRETPFRTSGRVGVVVPLFSTVPVLARNQDGSWVKVNYRGYVGWIVSFTGRDLPDLMAIPVAPGLPPPETANIVVIPPEVQLAQIARLREFVTPRRALSDGLAGFWLMVQRGEIMPCNPPEAVIMYQYTSGDVRELPELDRYAPQLEEGVNYLNTSLDVLRNCGVVGAKNIQLAYTAAINARVLFDSTLERLDTLEEMIR